MVRRVPLEGGSALPISVLPGVGSKLPLPVYADLLLDPIRRPDRKLGQQMCSPCLTQLGQAAPRRTQSVLAASPPCADLPPTPTMQVSQSQTAPSDRLCQALLTTPSATLPDNGAGMGEREREREKHRIEETFALELAGVLDSVDGVAVVNLRRCLPTY